MSETALGETSTPLPRNLTELLLATAARHGEREALVDGDVRLRYNDVVARACAVAERLQAVGVAAGDRVALVLPSGWRYPVVFFGVQLAGAVAVMVNTRQVKSEVSFVLEDCGARVVVTDDVLGERVEDRAGVARLHVGALTAPSLPLAGTGEPRGRLRRGSDVASLLYTSGTTGRPKGAMLTHRNLTTLARLITELARIAPEDRTLIAAPMFHATGINAQLLGWFNAGGTCVYGGAFSPGNTLKLFVAEQITVFIGVATMLGLMMRHPSFSPATLSSLRLYIMGGSPAPEALLAEGRAALPWLHFVNVWGLTECAGIATWCADEQWVARPWSVGPAALGVEVAIAVDEGEPRELRNTVGELCVRGDVVAAGYWNKPEATVATFRNGWLHTGDIGRIDDDGFVQVLDRLKDMIIRGGENIYCLEVENALAAHPSVAEVAVVGVPDALFGEQVRAAIVLRVGAVVTAASLREHALRRLADYKVPVEYVFVTELPRNPGGKVLKRELAAIKHDVITVSPSRGAGSS